MGQSGLCADLCLPHSRRCSQPIRSSAAACRVSSTRRWSTSRVRRPAWRRWSWKPSVWRNKPSQRFGLVFLYTVIVFIFTFELAFILIYFYFYVLFLVFMNIFLFSVNLYFVLVILVLTFLYFNFSQFSIANIYHLKIFKDIYIRKMCIPKKCFLMVLAVLRNQILEES